MKIAVVADMHGDFVALSAVMDAVKNKNPDLIICPGDITDMFNIPKEFSQMDIANIVVHKLLIAGKMLFCLPGNHDPYEIIDVFSEFNANLHCEVREACGIQFIGWGGAETPFNTLFEPSEEELAESLARLRKTAGRQFILVTHAPPKNTKIDMVADGSHVGSAALRKFIEKEQPVLAISAHIHESQGIDNIANTTLFYPGPAYDGFYGIVVVDGSKVSCKINRVHVARPAGTAKPAGRESGKTKKPVQNATRRRVKSGKT